MRPFSGVIFNETAIPGVFEIEIEPHLDERGFFARTWCQREFQAHGLNSNFVQCSLSFNSRKGTLRGMHYQAAPHAETKIVQCTRGSVFDVVIDLRPDSPKFKKHCAVVLTADKHNMVYVPAGCAHGFLTLEDNTAVFYQISEFHDPGAARGVRFDDPAFRISWPAKVEVISERDRKYPGFEIKAWDC